MSIPYTKLTGADAAVAGYLRIGHVILKMPPTDILTNYVSGKERISVLRGSNDLVNFTGRGRWDVTIRWTSMLDDIGPNIDYSQWEDLRTIVAIFKSAPFVEVENSYIRQNLCEQDPLASSSMRMAFGLRQLRISTHPDIVDAFDCSMTMTWFNYYPYSLDFGYQGANGESADANMSPFFEQYINDWKSNNMDKPLIGQNDINFPTTDWKTLTPGTLTFRWREYRTIKYNTLVVTTNGPQTSTGGPAVLTLPSKTSSSTIARNAAPVAQVVGAALNVDPHIIFAQWAFETAGFTNRGATQLNNLSGINIKGGNGTQYQTYASLTSYGIAYVSLIKKNYPQCVGSTSISQYVTGLKHNGVYPSYFTSDLSSYISGVTAHQNDYYTYLSLGPVPVTASTSTPNTQQPNLANAAVANPTTTPTTTSSNTNSLSTPMSFEKFFSSLSSDDQQQVQEMVDAGWKPDYFSNDLIYMYLDHELQFNDIDHANTSGIKMFPRNISILMVNNIAQVPLAFYPFPTYQHVGSPSSQASVGFISIGRKDNEDSEPVHTGISLLRGISTFLDQQYLSYRHNWRNVDSLHRMQAVYVESQVFNMFGIRGLTFDNIITETVPESSNEAQAELVCTQYENIFESTPPFKINTIEQAAASVTQNILNTGGLSTLALSEQAVVPLLTSFAQGRASANIDTLANFIISAGSQKTGVFNGFGSLPAVSTSSQQISEMLVTVTSNSQAPTNTNIQTSLSDIVTSNTNNYSSITQRLQNNKAGWTVGDLCLAYALAKEDLDSEIEPGDIDPDAVTVIKKAQSDASSLLNGNTSGIQAVYDAMFNIMSGTNPAFATQVNTLSNSPAFSSQYLSAFDVKGPALSTANNDALGSHSCYRGMGLAKSYSATGLDYTPAYYFTNHSDRRQEILRQQIEQVVSQTKSTTTQVNSLDNASEFDIVISNADFTGLNYDTNSLISMTNLPGLTMAEAFPTFKLFLMEDEAGGLINCFDNFYSYASVTEMEVIRYRDQPDVAVLQITNISNLLLQHLYDDTMMGRYQYGLNKYQNATPSSPSTGQGIGAVIAGKTLSGQPYMLDLSDGYVTGQRQRIQLQYIALQAGSKIQVRMGFSNDPDNLTPVFTGRVTKVDSEGDMLTVTAESYLGELCTLPVYNGSPLGEKTFGKEWTNADSGDVASVVEKLLETDTAKHFGRLKLATASDSLVSGFTWTQRLGSAVVSTYGVAPNNILTEIGAAMASSYDRKGENILINHMIEYTAIPKQLRTGTPISTRSFQDQSSTILYLSFDYAVKENSTFTTWDLIKDVCRRYPEYNVCCKQYGFPFSADATLLVGHPLDYYFARPPMIGDAETYNSNASAVSDWNEWWNSAGGKEDWAEMIKRISKDGIPTSLLNIGTPTDPTSFDMILQQAAQKLLVLEGGPPNSGSYVNDILEEMARQIIVTPIVIGSALNLTVGAGNSYAELKGQIKAAISEMINVRNSWYKYLQLKHPTNFDRLKPVRRYHLIDQDMIVHNGLRLNEKIYNAIKVGSDTICANNNIPSHYRRVLDVTGILNYPEKNILGYDRKNIRNLIAQSFLRDEVGKMYEGEIVLRGTPEIEPYDCLILLDPSTAMTGVVEVDKVIQSFTLETGYITIVYPRTLVGINESASAGISRMLSMVWAKTIFNFNGINPFNSSSGFSKAWQSLDGIEKGVGITATATAVGGTIALLAFAGPPGWVCALLASALIMGGVLATGLANETANNIEIIPLSRFGRPWIGGLEGYQITDFWANLASTFKEWEADQIFPLIDTYRTLVLGQQVTLPVQPNT